MVVNSTCGLYIPVRRRSRTLKACPTDIGVWKEVKCFNNASQLMCSGLGEVRGDKWIWKMALGSEPLHYSRAYSPED